MAAQFTILYGGTLQTLDAWDVEAAALTWSVGGDDALTLSTTEQLGAAAQFAFGETLELFDPEGVRRFMGIVLKPTRIASGERVRRGYLVASPAWWLKKVHLRQEWRFLLGDDIDIEEITTALLGRRTLDLEVIGIVNTAVVAGANILLNGLDLPANLHPEDKQRGLKCWDALRRMLGWSPYLECRWSYEGDAGDPAELQFFSMLRTGFAYGLPANRYPLRTVRPVEVENFKGDPRYDLLERQIIVRFIERVQSGGLTYRQITTDSATASPDNNAFGTIEFDVELRAPSFNGSTYDPGEQVITGLAQRMGAAYFSLWHDLSWSKKGTTCDFSVKPGEMWNVADGDPEFADAQAICQSVTFDLRAHTTTVKCGPGAQLGLGSLLDLVRANRTRHAPTPGDVSQQDYGTGEPEPDTTSSAVKAVMGVQTGVATWINKVVTLPAGTVTEDMPA
jgi:hypothetical protein